MMALGRAFSVAVRGLEGKIVEIEADITSGLPGVHLVGLPDTALQESRDRVRAAITNCGNSWPMARLTLALSPATLPKMGSVPSTTWLSDLAAAMNGPATSTNDCPCLGGFASRYTRWPTRSGTRSAAPVIAIPP